MSVKNGFLVYVKLVQFISYANFFLYKSLLLTLESVSICKYKYIDQKAKKDAFLIESKFFQQDQ